MKKPRSLNRAAAVQYAMLVEEAYWMFENDSSGTAQPPPRSPFPVPGYKFVTWVQMKNPLFDPNPSYAFYGMIAQSTTDPDKFVLAIRGTDSYQEMLQDLWAIWLVDWDFGKVGFCFSEIYKTMRIVLPIPIPIPPPGTFAHQVAAVVQHAAAAARPPSAKVKRDISVVVTGHSLGAALGTLYVAQNAHAKLLTNPLICTFGSPRVGDPEFVRNFNRLRMTSSRIVNEYDPIPDLPPEIFGFKHIKGLQSNKMTTEVVPHPVCFHHIKTYQHLLDARRPLSQECRFSSQRPRSLPLKPKPIKEMV
jgi:hypothetical protein